MIKKLMSILTTRDKNFFLFLVVLSIFVSMIETIGISIIMPFIAVATDFSLIDTKEYYALVYNLFNFDNHIDFVVAFGVALVIFYALRSIINLAYLHLIAKFSFGRYHLFVNRLFNNYLKMSYKDFVEKNTSNLTKSITIEANNLTHIISAVLIMTSEIFVVIFIYIAMLYANWKITLLLTILLAINAIFLLKVVSKKIKLAGAARASIQKTFFEIMNKTFGNFKIIKLNSNSEEIIKNFSKTSFAFSKTNITNQTLLSFPRLFLEAIGFILVCFIIVYLVIKYQTDISSTIALISIFVLGLYRLLPSANRILSSYNQILFSHKSIDIVYDEITHNGENLQNTNINFAKNICLQNINFEYTPHKPILKNINLTINKGESIAFIGESGSGKSTLVDLIIGLYKPQTGEIKIDGVLLDDTNIKQWRRKVGYIPQSVYLFDGTVSQNVAFEERNINENKVKEVLKQANILDFLQKEQDGINTLVGEGGVKLSGGQKQRVAIARALYHNPEILVLDEATSALDSDTEKKIMQEIYAISKDKTLIIIAHRLSTIVNCDIVFNIRNKEVYKEEM